MSSVLISIIWIISVIFANAFIINKHGGEVKDDGSIKDPFDGMGWSIAIGSIITIIICFIAIQF